VVKVYELFTNNVSHVSLLYAQLVFDLAKHSSQRREVCIGFSKNYAEFVWNRLRIWAVVFDGGGGGMRIFGRRAAGRGWRVWVWFT
jgi:hypothetical protein